MNKPNNPNEHPERDADKIVNFLGIKQSWWATTSSIHSLLMDIYSVVYLIFILEYEGGVGAVVFRAGTHLLAASGLLMLFMLMSIHTGAFFMMIHDRYREWRDNQIREAEEATRVEKEARQAAEAATRAAAETIALLQQERDAWKAWNERRLYAQETGELFDEPPPNGTEAQVEQVRQEQAAFNAWFERRIAAARQGEPFDEPPPNGTGGDAAP